MKSTGKPKLFTTTRLRYDVNRTELLIAVSAMVFPEPVQVLKSRQELQ
ncbi:MAG: hypothetical protein WCK84_00470 [Bacteroidota bacterium]